MRNMFKTCFWNSLRIINADCEKKLFIYTCINLVKFRRLFKYVLNIVFLSYEVKIILEIIKSKVGRLFVGFI